MGAESQISELCYGLSTRVGSAVHLRGEELLPPIIVTEVWGGTGL